MQGQDDMKEDGSDWRKVLTNDSTSCSSLDDLIFPPAKVMNAEGTPIAMTDVHSHENIDLEHSNHSRSIAMRSLKILERTPHFQIPKRDCEFESLGKRQMQVLALDCFSKRCSRIDNEHFDLENLINQHFSAGKNRLQEISARFDFGSAKSLKK